ncbi:MAG: L-2-hydroxyglutarate oxidase [Nitrospirae bacterium]|nr:L-2-hydroxyglutarate oxidase [Candidatus Manganitrophaceae bacterium]
MDGSLDKPAENYDFIIVGAGILGLTTAHELKKRYPEARVALLEKEPHVGMHASGRNSGVLHSGIYYGSETLKAKVCSIGAARMCRFAEEYGISYHCSGKVIIATGELDLPVVDRLLKNARENKIRAELLGEEEIKKIEPHAGPYKVGIYSPDTAVIDSLAVVRKLASLLSDRGSQILFNEEVHRIQSKERIVHTNRRRYGYGHLFNCAGANADLIAKKMGLGSGYALLPFKGLYYKLRPERNGLVKGSIYPVPDIRLPFLGVHLTRVVSGDVYVGPTAIPALGRENYGIFGGIKMAEGLRIGRHVAGMYLRNHQNFRLLVHTEMRKYRKRSFLEAARKLVPELTSEDLVPSNKVGIRPQLVNIEMKKLEMDYIIEETPTSTHVLNAISPAFTSSFAFAELLVDRYEKSFKQTVSQ